MWLTLGLGVDLLHAFAMGAWFLGIPLLFVTRWPRLRLTYAIYAVTFIVLSQASMLVFGECFLTEITQWSLRHAPGRVVDNEWFTVRVARDVFGMAPSRRGISRISELLVLATAAGVLVASYRSMRARVRRWYADARRASTPTRT